MEMSDNCVPCVDTKADHNDKRNDNDDNGNRNRDIAKQDIIWQAKIGR